ncbi:MAG: hypothetical protein JO235_24595 [Chroococcidiopsidaceae cyanobacterium CP_BM_RX_35]|nr:hypothetical protein [Chroococcidiopsidaceae cyanobacterium CP_BM_RX_35]
MPKYPNETAEALESDALKSERHGKKIEKIGQSIKAQELSATSRGEIIEQSAQTAIRWAQAAGFHARMAQRQNDSTACIGKCVQAQKEEGKETKSIIRAVKEYSEFLKDRLSKWREFQ